MSSLNPLTIQRILIVRINYRIGNILFLTPLINALAKKIPHASIDVVVGAKFTAPLLSSMNVVNEVYDIPRKVLRNPFLFRRKVKQINANNYDLVISPTVGSGSANLALKIIRSPRKLSFHTVDYWSAANYRVPLPDGVSHEALLPLSLMRAFDNDQANYSRSLDIRLTADERAKGREQLNTLLQHRAKTNKLIVGIFRDARNEKKLSEPWWHSLLEQLHRTERFHIIDILPPGHSQPVHPDCMAASFSDLRALGSFISAVDVFVSADTGPMHLASAVQTRVIAFFNATQVEKYGPLGHNDRVIWVNGKPITHIGEELLQHIDENEKHWETA